MATKVIALNGPAGSGKSEAAAYLQHGHGFTIVKFAGPLKAMLRAFYREVGLSDAEIQQRLEGDLKEVPCDHLMGQTPRHAMETLGTEWGRNCIHPKFWVNAWSTKVDTTEGPVAADDCRFDNEAETTHEKGGAVVKLVPKVRRRKRSKHVAENGLSPHLIDHRVMNDEGIGKLRGTLDAILYPHAEETFGPLSDY